MDCKISCEFDKEREKTKEYCIDLEDMPLAMSYVPWQEWRNVMEPDMGLREGTIFAELVLPYIGKKAACREYQERQHPLDGSCMHDKQMKEMGRVGFSRSMSNAPQMRFPSNMECGRNMDFTPMKNECENVNMRGRRCNRV